MEIPKPDSKKITNDTYWGVNYEVMKDLETTLSITVESIRKIVEGLRIAYSLDIEDGGEDYGSPLLEGLVGLQRNYIKSQLIWARHKVILERLSDLDGFSGGLVEKALRLCEMVNKSGRPFNKEEE